MPANFGRAPFQTTGYAVRVSADGQPKWKIGGITLNSATLPVNSTGSDLTLTIDQTLVRNKKLYLLLGTVMCRITSAAAANLAITGGPTGGTYTASVTTPSGTVTTAQTTSAIAYNAIASTVQTALQALSNVGSGNATVLGVELDTFTPGTPTAGDTISVNNSAGVSLVEITVGASPSATTITTQLKQAWNDSPSLTALAAAGGTSTFTLTGVVAGQALNLTPSIQGTGTFTKAITNAPAAGNAPFTISFANSLGPVNVTASGTLLTGGTSPAATATAAAAGGNVGYFGPYNASATDGTQSLNRGDCYILDETWLDTEVPAFPGQGTIHPPVFDGGRIDIKKVVLSGGQGTNTLPADYPAGPTLANFLAAFPNITPVND